MSISNAALKERLANHLAAPLTAGFVGSMRQAFGKVDVTYVSEGPVHYGKPTLLTDIETVSIPGKMKGKKQLPSVQFTIGRAA